MTQKSDSHKVQKELDLSSTNKEHQKTDNSTINFKKEHAKIRLEQRIEKYRRLINKDFTEEELLEM